jgi:hypothetical protein
VTRNANTVTCHRSRNWSPCEANIGARNRGPRSGALMSATKFIRYEAAVRAVAEAKKIRDHADRRVNASSARRKATASDFQHLPTLADVYAAHDSANRDLYLKRHGRMPAGGSRLGTTSADAYARGHSAGDIGLDAQVKGKATRALPNMKANRDG